jgi:putative MATE family efflux protein
MIGSAAQNVIALTDSLFLYHYRELEFATIGVVSVFYLIISAIGFGFSRGGQILIARAYGAADPSKIGKIFRAILVFEIGLALLLFFFLIYGSEWVFNLVIDDPSIAQKSVEYLKTRALGIFFSYAGVCFIALYSGLARTWFITVDTALLLISNIILNYSLIFGKWGLPEMGIAGAGLASSISEGIAFFGFLLYMLFDKKIRKYRLFYMSNTDWDLIRYIYRMSVSMVVLSVLSLGSWFIFFSLIENMGQRALAISNVGRIAYLILTVPIWGFSSGINTLASQLVGNRKRHGVLPMVWKTTNLSVIISVLISLPVCLMPQLFLFPLFGESDVGVVTESVPLIRLLFFIILIFSLGSIHFNGLVGTGSVWLSIRIQAVVTLIYLVYTYTAVNIFAWDLIWVWSAEIFYWFLLFLGSFYYLKTRGWVTISYGK